MRTTPSRCRPASGPSRAKRASYRDAFTLLEVLIAIALVLMLSGVLFGFLHDMLSTRRRTLERAMQQRAAATLIERIESSAAACVVGNDDRAGVQGDATHLRLLTRGVMPQLADRGLDDPTALGDLQVVEYRFDPARHRLEAGKAAAGETIAFAPLGGEVPHARFRYLDGRQWTESFDSLALSRLPTAIEVAVWFNPWPGDVDTVESLAEEADESFGNERAATRPGNFDEQAHADANEAAAFRSPPPDRVRIIVIPDGDAEGESSPATRGQS